MVEGPQPPPIETVVTNLANDLGSVGSDVLLVLDDFHVIDASDIQDQVSFLLEQLADIGAHSDRNPRRSTVSASASEGARRISWKYAPRICNSRMRRPLVLLNLAAGLELDSEAGRRAGGAHKELEFAALRLAASSMQGLDDVDAFIEGFCRRRRSLRRRLPRRGGAGAPMGDVRRFLLGPASWIG